MKKIILSAIALSLILVTISGCFSNNKTGNSKPESDELNREINDLRNEVNSLQKDLSEAMEIITELSLIIEAQENANNSQQSTSSNMTGSDDDLLFMSPTEFENIYVILMYHSDMIDGRLSKLEAMKLRSIWLIERNLQSGIMQRVAYYAMFGELAYIDKFRHRNEITLEQVRERILEVLARYDNDMTLEELNNNIIIAQEIFDRMGVFD